MSREVSAVRDPGLRTSLRATVVALAVASGVAGCDGASVPSDAEPDVAECWFTEPRYPQGSVALGVGRDAFQPMPDPLPLEFGSQLGFMFVVSVNMQGFSPGDPANILASANPRTRLRAFFDASNVPLNRDATCPFRTPYRAAPQGGHVPVDLFPIVFDTCWRSAHLFGQRIRIELEMLDARGGYASQTRVVTASPPVGPHEVGDGPGCPL
jgi:hypothetical protein